MPLVLIASAKASAFIPCSRAASLGVIRLLREPMIDVCVIATSAGK